MYLHYILPIIYNIFPNVWKASYAISVPIFFEVPYWPPYSTDKFISCAVPGPSQWFFHFGKETVITWTQEKTMTLVGGIEPHHSSWNARSPTAAVMDLLRRWQWEILWNIQCTHLIWVHMITISSPQRKNHCQGSGTVQEVVLSVVWGGLYKTSTYMDAQFVYDAFQRFCKSNK